MRIPPGYDEVDPRTARRVPLTLSLDPTFPLYPGDPPYAVHVAADTRGRPGGYLVERITSLGTHTATHLSAPAHLHRGGAMVADLDERIALMPLALIDVRGLVGRSPAHRVSVDELDRWERQHGIIPVGGCVALLTGLSAMALTDPEGYVAAAAPGLSAAAAEWLFTERKIVALASDSLGPDAADDAELGATATALRHGGITVENLGPRLSDLRPSGDWLAVNANRPALSGFPAGVTGFTTDRGD